MTGCALTGHVVPWQPPSRGHRSARRQWDLDFGGCGIVATCNPEAGHPDVLNFVVGEPQLPDAA